MRNFKKHVWKAIPMILVLVMMMSMTAFAAEETGSITITNATIDETYAVYKIFDASIKMAADGETAEAVSTLVFAYEFPQAKSKGQPKPPLRL